MTMMGYFSSCAQTIAGRTAVTIATPKNNNARFFIIPLLDLIFLLMLRCPTACCQVVCDDRQTKCDDLHLERRQAFAIVIDGSTPEFVATHFKMKKRKAAASVNVP